jgi:hypothetical protein
MFCFGLIEYGRMMFIWNALPEVARRAARAAAMTDFTDPAALQAVRTAALLGSGGTLPMASNVGSGNLRIEYLWQDAAGNIATVPVMPGCPLANRINCTRDPHGASCIRFVRVRLCGNDGGAGCPALEYQPISPVVAVPATLPPASVTVPAESLGFTPGQPPCP